jgi:hypothetical protein
MGKIAVVLTCTSSSQRYNSNYKAYFTGPYNPTKQTFDYLDVWNLTVDRFPVIKEAASLYENTRA